MSVASPIKASAVVTLGHKACAGLAFTCALAVLAGLFSLGQQMRLYRFVGRTTQQDVASRSAAGELAVSVMQCRRYERDLLCSVGDPQALSAAEERCLRSCDDLCNSLHEIQATCWTTTEMGQIDTYLEATRAYRENLREVADTMRHGRITRREEAESAIASRQGDMRPQIAEAVVFAQHKIDVAAKTGKTLADSAIVSITLTGVLLLLPGGLLISAMICLSGAKGRFFFRSRTVSQSSRFAAERRMDRPEFPVGCDQATGTLSTPTAVTLGNTLHPDDLAESRLLDSLRTIADEIAEQTQPPAQRAGSSALPIPLANDEPVAR
jgi:CHASE3 domain sensor protein